MKTIKLSSRLKMIAELAGYSTCVADVGTDHAYIPIWLLQSGRAKHVIASDIHREPLERAKLNAAEYALESAMDFVLSDGLKHLTQESAETVIIAGMGGETILDILRRASWTAEGKHRFVLQPMTKIPELSAWLYQNGFLVNDARLAEDGGEIYIALEVKAGLRTKPSPAGLLIPDALIKNEDALLTRYLDKTIVTVSYAIRGLKSANALKEPGRLESLESLLKELESIRRELTCRQ